MAVPLQTTIRDLGYATLGAGDLAAEAARNLTRAPVELSAQLREFREKAPDLVQKRYEELTDRGRKVAGQFRRNPAVKDAVGRAEKVQREVKSRTPGTSSASSSPSTRYENRTLEELQDLAAARAVEGRSTMKKAELIAALRAGE